MAKVYAKKNILVTFSDHIASGDMCVYNIETE